MTHNAIKLAFFREYYAKLCVFSHKTVLVNKNQQKPFEILKNLLYLGQQIKDVLS